MNPVDIIASVLVMHRPIAFSEETGDWHYLCVCGDVGDDHDRHVAEEAVRLLYPPLPLIRTGVVEGVGWTQLPLVAP